MNGFGDEIAKAAGRAMIWGICILVAITITAFLIGRYSA